MSESESTIALRRFLPFRISDELSDSGESFRAFRAAFPVETLLVCFDVDVEAEGCFSTDVDAGSGTPFDGPSFAFSP